MSVANEVPSVTVTVEAVLPVPGPAGPARVTLSDEPLTVTVRFGSVVLALNPLPLPPAIETEDVTAQPTVTGFGTI